MQDSEARRAMAAATRDLPEAVLRRLVGYLGLHTPAGRAMSWPKTARLIDELICLINAGTVQRNRQAPRASPPELWGLALDEVMAARDAGTLSLPLQGHGFLEEIAFRLAGQVAAKGEATSLARSRGETPLGQHPSHKPFRPPLPPAQATGGLQQVGDYTALRAALNGKQKATNNET